MDFNIDMQALVEELKNRAMLTIVAAMTPDDTLRTPMLGILEVFIRHGISVDEAMKIIVEIAKILNPEIEEKESEKNEN